jgi:lipopolysaccharide export system protein LptA
MKARGNVRSTLKPGARKERNEPRPSILEDDEPVNVTAKSLDYDGKTERAVYTGDARLWQADTVIHGETIVLDDKTGNLEARKAVRAQFLIRDENAPASGAEDGKPKPTFGRGDELVYVESRRQATFRGSAKITGPDGDITGDRIELFLEEDGNTLERAEAYENVTARLDGGRVATGSRLVYAAKTRRYDMRGAPLKVRRQFTEKAGDGLTTTRCEETVGSSLTFDRSADTVSVVGANGAPSRTVPVPCTPGGTRP